MNYKIRNTATIANEDSRGSRLSFYSMCSQHSEPLVFYTRTIAENKFMDSLRELWPGMNIVHGKPRHLQPHGNVERANRDVEDMLFTWRSENKTKTWSHGLSFVQFMKNRAA